MIRRYGLVGQKKWVLNGEQGVGVLYAVVDDIVDIGRNGWIWERVFPLYCFVAYAFNRSFSVDDDIE